jgi:hypothetical protein
MDHPTLDLFDLSAYQALVALRDMLQAHPLASFMVRGEDDTIRANVQRQLEKQGRRWTEQKHGRSWQLEVESLGSSSALPKRQPVLVLRSAFTPGDRALGRKLLLQTLRNLDRGVPWVCLAHEAVELLEDETAMEALHALREEGIAIFLSATSCQFYGKTMVFPELSDDAWQAAYGRGELTIL